MPKVGDAVQVTASVNTGSAGPPTQPSVSGASPILEVLEVTGGGGFGGGNVVVQLRALQSGTTTLTVSFEYEITVAICDPRLPTYAFVRGSASVDVTVLTP